MPSLAEIANDYVALMAAGETLAAAEKYWASDIVALEPSGSTPAGTAIGKPAARARLTRWLAAHAMTELMIDGPFVTGNQFALFIDMEITRRDTGERRPFSEIAVYIVCQGKITEERHFHE